MDREILLNTTGQLNDDIIDAAQLLLAQQFPYLPGLQSVRLGLTCALHHQPGEFLSVNKHWVTISNVGVNEPATVKVYDSLMMLSLPSYRLK